MNEPMPIYLRAHTELAETKRPRKRNKRQPPKYPEYALVFDCETLLDTSQALTFCGYQICRRDEDSWYFCVEEGLVVADGVTAKERLTVRKYARSHDTEACEGPANIRVLSQSSFIEKVFFPLAYEAGALICGFNLPFDLSRLALDAREARGNRGWSLIMSHYKDKKTGRQRENPFRPRIIISPKDSKAAFITFAGCKDGRYKRARFLDLRTLAWALRNESYRLDSACEAFSVPGKLDHQPSGTITSDEIDYCRQDVRASVALLNAELAEFDSHPIDLLPDRAVSSASIGKAYLSEMGVIPPLQKFRVSPAILGVAMQAYYGGRAECRIRNTSVPVALVDFTSQYPTVNTLLGLWNVLTAESIRFEDARDEVRRMVSKVTLEDARNPKFWKRLSWFALVRPEGDVLPVRTTYNADAYNIGLNHLDSGKPIWLSGPDVVASVLYTGKPPEILRAIRMVPKGKQKGLKPVEFRGETLIDPRKVDFFKTVIEARAVAKEKKQEALAYALKILANATSYGLFVEVNPTRVNGRDNVRIFSGEDRFSSSAQIIETKGNWYFPPIAALITGGGRLLLAMLECIVAKAGGTYLFADTDSMGIVATKRGGLVPCIGGPHRLPNGGEAVKAFSFENVREIVLAFDPLNPYDKNLVSDLLKIEKMQSGLNGYAISTKRYALYSRTVDGVKVEKASEHGLGYLYPPKFGFNDDIGAPDWIVELWEYILRGVESLPPITPSWFDQSAMMRFTITTPQVLKPLQRLQKNVSLCKRAKPYNFVLSPILNRFVLAGFPEPITLITPFTHDPKQLSRQHWVNIHNGRIYRTIPVPTETHREIVEEFCVHRESKSRAPDGKPCDFDTRGLLKRTHVICTSVVAHGKETDRQWERGEDISVLFPLLPEYLPNETEKMVSDPVLPSKIRQMSIREMAQKSGLSTRTVRAARRGKRLQKSTILKLQKTLSEALDSEDSDSPNEA